MSYIMLGVWRMEKPTEKCAPTPGGRKKEMTLILELSLEIIKKQQLNNKRWGGKQGEQAVFHLPWLFHSVRTESRSCSPSKRPDWVMRAELVGR